MTSASDLCASLYSFPTSSDTHTLIDAVMLEGQLAARDARPVRRAPVAFSAPSRQKAVHGDALRSLDGQVQEVYGQQAGSEMESERWVKAVVKEVPTTNPRTQSILNTLHSLTASGAVPHEEIITLLLTEARRIQWEQAQQEASSSGTTRTSTRTSGTSYRRMHAQRVQPDVSREQAIMKEMYEKVTSAGAADAEGMLDVLLAEAVRTAKEGEQRQKAVLAKL
ncbi:uncharacterized protein SPPG_07040 [Spizellomyces punctatus DAOM BR117]|uniref:Uncharacterized protein n=1 Tax=Spizellomyces punctatus (strain DAOM BR117) TaxID=645134 RepID=A0A0L0H8R5_SPIPD|nr:uncharacterized protein SPPG_07040 [Spizellomyces punctatus DAOM BR117]KNC97567.1 hypothetical protein SPPG_07040 [Spizellomyces punctatus DAOM BR117]|eukprot:XP_016605607.1 hypothetical protein SPPG_07040 [Spizellomyces punctatus DAOM BR117]